MSDGHERIAVDFDNTLTRGEEGYIGEESEEELLDDGYDGDGEVGGSEHEDGAHRDASDTCAPAGDRTPKPSPGVSNTVVAHL